MYMPGERYRSPGKIFFVFRIDRFPEKEYNSIICPKIIKGEGK